MMASPGILLWSIVFGAFGMAYLVYGKRQAALVPFLTGVALLIYPYFVANVYWLVGIGAALVATPYFIRPD
jgi:hypothetical protein